MKKNSELLYEELEMEVIAFDTEDIICASGTSGEQIGGDDSDAIKPPVNTFDF